MRQIDQDGKGSLRAGFRRLQFALLCVTCYCYCVIVNIETSHDDRRVEEAGVLLLSCH